MYTAHWRPGRAAHQTPWICEALCIAAAAVIGFGSTSQRAEAGATSFEEPTLWSVGDVDSTFQEWNATDFAFASSDTVPTASNVNPAIASTPLMNVLLPGFRAGSGGYYSLSGPYGVVADVFNHGGSAGSGSYPTGSGTHVIVQTAATLNTDIDTGLVADQLHLTLSDGTPITGGDNADLLRTEELFVGNVLTSFGIVPQQELIFEFFLPDFTGDFRLNSTSELHSSFQHLRVDTFIVAGSGGPDPDLDSDGDVDIADLVAWQNTPPSDAAGLAAWEAQVGSGASASAAIAAVPEPTASGLLIFGITSAMLPIRRKA